jgi:tRNA (guanosine-2'-O-)-methyltransferase
MDYSHFLDRLDPARRRELEAQLTDVILPRRIERMDAVLARRTRRLTVLFEDLYHPHNASAVMRTAECFGVQDIHVVEQDKRFRPSKDVVRGAARWLTLHRYADLAGALAALRRGGYRLAATSVDPGSLPLDEVPVDTPLALCFGTEETGLSSQALAAADLHVHVPMAGFTESLNVSVTAALCLRELSGRIRAGSDWELTAQERADLRLTWLMQEGTKARALTVARLRQWDLVGRGGGAESAD